MFTYQIEIKVQMGLQIDAPISGNLPSFFKRQFSLFQNH